MAIYIKIFARIIHAPLYVIVPAITAAAAAAEDHFPLKSIYQRREREKEREREREREKRLVHSAE